MDLHTALVLAGTRAGGDPLAECAGVTHKALIDVGGQPMIARVVTALTAVPGLERILIAIERPEILQGCDLLHGAARHVPIEIVPTSSGPSATVAAVLELHSTPLLVTTADHALLRPEWVTDFLQRVPAKCDAAVLLATRAKVLAALPETQRTFLRFADGEWSGCNLFLLRTPRALSGVRFWQSVETDRKRPVQLVRRLGIWFALRYQFGYLPLGDALARVQALCGARIAVVESAFGLAAVDVDKRHDLDLVRRLVAEGRG